MEEEIFDKDDFGFTNILKINKISLNIDRVNKH